ncbi:ABC transporter ATP-binding protein [Azospirillum soli]|uniref:ABC transporter ATP-binding protein n=1 Tax=Azospirillum soli TaxID=1304799 RepID=UPI001AE3354D|nr:ABC transporter ATP-binding protein [Azospirillum soli]MBP2316370.1 iron complex transport system ATP-binding protein [Azospirillum soli]
MSARLAVEDLAFGYGERTVGASVGFAVGVGEVLCLLGPNGSGKTTLFKTILGLLPPRGGRIRVDGEDAGGWTPRRRALAFGYVPQAGAGQFSFSVSEMVLMGRTAHRGPFTAPAELDHAAATAALDRLGIAHLAERDWLRISGGERQLALIARALAQAPRVLVLDEPTASLDFGNQVRVLEQVRRLADEDGLAVVFSTHHPEQAFAIADRVALLHNGRLARLGSPDEVITAAMMREVYGTEVDVLTVGDGGMRVCLPRTLRRGA